MTRIAFTADLHVDGYGTSLDPETGMNRRLSDYLRTLATVAQEAKDVHGADMLVVAGDFTERRHPAPWLVSRIRDALNFGPGPQVYVRGNHDGEIAGRSIVTLLQDRSQDRYGVSRPELIAAGDDTFLACIPYLDRHWLRAQSGLEHVPDDELYPLLGEQFVGLASGIYAHAKKTDPERAVVLVCHQTLAGAAMSDSQRAFLGDLSLVVDARALQAIGFEAVVAGHLHRHQVVLPGDRPVLYTGSIERVDFGEESETKGYIVADVTPGTFDWKFVETAARRFVTLDFSYDSDDNRLEDVGGAIVRAINVDEEDVVELRAEIEAAGAFDITEIRRRPTDRVEITGGISESLTTAQALEAYFADEPDAEALVAAGREILVGLA